VVKSSGVAVSVSVKDWVDRYRADRPGATAELLTFLTQACGVPDRPITPDEVEGTGVDELREELDVVASKASIAIFLLHYKLWPLFQ
jgi:hypothetical protein